MTSDQMATRIAELESMLAEEQKNVAYWREIAEMMRLRARSLAEELDFIK